MRCRTETFISFWLSCVFTSTAWKNVLLVLKEKGYSLCRVVFLQEFHGISFVVQVFHSCWTEIGLFHSCWTEIGLFQSCWTPS